MSEEKTLKSVFQDKYDEFCNELVQTVPEIAEAVNAAKALSPEERFSRFTAEILPHAAPNRNSRVCPAFILPGVSMTTELWDDLGEPIQNAIQEFMTLLAICCLFETGKADKDSVFGEKGADFMDDFLKNMRTKMNSEDFSSIAKKMASLFGVDGNNMPKLPEKFMKGHLARLAEEIMKDFKPEDLGLDEETIKRLESDPMNAFEMMMKMYTSNPGFISGTVQKIARRLQAKIQSGAIRPSEIVAEAEELMKTFSENPAFVDLMESFRSMFGMEDPDLARAAGKPENARRAIIQERLRKKVAARQATAGGGAGASTPEAERAAAAAIAELLASETRSTPPNSNKKAASKKKGGK